MQNYIEKNECVMVVLKSAEKYDHRSTVLAIFVPLCVMYYAQKKVLIIWSYFSTFMLWKVMFFYLKYLAFDFTSNK